MEITFKKLVSERKERAIGQDIYYHYYFSILSISLSVLGKGAYMYEKAQLIFEPEN